MSSTKRTPIAVLGAGIFAKTAHLPAIAAAPSLDVVAVYSRSEESARSLLAAANDHPTLRPSGPIKIYFDVPSTSSPQPSSGTLDDLLGSADIELIVTSLPIPIQAKVLEKAILKGKSIFSEKPIAKDLEEAKALVKLYEKEKKEGQGWLIAEQYPYEPTYNDARNIIESGKLGALESFDFEQRTYVEPGSKYYETAWRKVPSYQGGVRPLLFGFHDQKLITNWPPYGVQFLLDGGVHYFAGLRWMLPGRSFTSITATATLLQPHLPPYDLLKGTILSTSETDSSVVPGTFHISFGEKGDRVFRFTFRGSLAALTIELQGREMTLTVTPVEGEPQVTKKLGCGVEKEFEAIGEAFAKGVGGAEWKKCESRSGVKVAMRDLSCIEGGLTSSEKGEAYNLKHSVGEFW